MGEYTVVWDIEGRSITQDNKKCITNNQFGTKGLSQGGGSHPGPSLISFLTIAPVEQADIGIYGCRIIGSVGCSQVIGYIQVSTGIQIPVYIEYVYTNTSMHVAHSHACIFMCLHV